METDKGLELTLLIQSLKHTIEENLTAEIDSSIYIPSNVVVSKCLNDYRKRYPQRMCTSWLWGSNMILQNDSTGKITSLAGTCFIFIFGAANLANTHVDHINNEFMTRGNIKISYRLQFDNQEDMVGKIENGDMAIVYKVEGHYGTTQLSLKLYTDVIKKCELIKFSEIYFMHFYLYVFL